MHNHNIRSHCAMINVHIRDLIVSIPYLRNVCITLSPRIGPLDVRYLTVKRTGGNQHSECASRRVIGIQCRNAFCDRERYLPYEISKRCHTKVGTGGSGLVGVEGNQGYGPQSPKMRAKSIHHWMSNNVY